MSHSEIDPRWPGPLIGGALALFVVAAACWDQGETIARQLRTAPSGAAGAAGNEHAAADDGGQANGSAGAGGTADASGGRQSEIGRPVFETPTVVDGLNDPEAKDQDPTLTEDLLEILFFSDREGGEDLWASRRATIDASWDPPTVVTELNSDAVEQSPAISRDGLRLWYYSRREPPGLWYSERETRDDRWSAPVAIPVQQQGTAGVVIAPALDSLELRMAVSIGISESRDIFELVRPFPDAPWGDPAPLAGLNGDTADSTPFLIDDGREVLFASGRSGNGDLFWGYRTTPAAPVERIEPLSELNDPEQFESHPHLAVDRSVVFFGSTRTGNTDIYQAVVR